MDQRDSQLTSSVMSIVFPGNNYKHNVCITLCVTLNVNLKYVPL